jgi:hypothetical protein
MSDELKAEIESLKAENQKLKETAAAAKPAPDERVAKANAEARDRRLAAKQLREELDNLKAENQELKTKSDGDHQGLKAELEKVTGELREVKHKEAFARAAKAHRVSDPTRLSDLYSVSGYKIEGDKPDPAKIGELIKGVLKDRPYLVDADASAPEPITAAQARQAGRPKAQPPAPAVAAAADRGASVASDAPRATNRIPGRL